jgi:bacterioferritin (cytochrome b1)
MNTIELKKELIERISMIEDVPFLNAIKTILDYKKKENFIELTLEQEKEILLASEEGKKGINISKSQMDQMVEEWLKEK